IGMKHGPSGLAPSADFVTRLEHWLDRRPSLSGCEIALDLHEPLIDSAEAAPGHWSSIAQKLWSKRRSFDAAVVLHGTDTLAYTASALSFLLTGLGKPIILTGSQAPFWAARSDAPSNLRDALRCALSPEVVEVCICFDGVLLRGNRTRKYSTHVGD